jgi:hypothetical protein
MYFAAAFKPFDPVRSPFCSPDGMLNVHRQANTARLCPGPAHDPRRVTHAYHYLFAFHIFSFSALLKKRGLVLGVVFM